MAAVSPASVSQSSKESETTETEDPIVARLLAEKDAWRPYGKFKLCCGDLIMFGPIRSWWWILEIYTIAVTVVFFYEYKKYESLIYPIVGGIGYFIVFVSSWKALFCNPGIVRRPPFQEALSNAREVEQMTKSGVPYPTRRVDMGDSFKTFNYCMDCHLFRPPGTGHCHICDCCVERMDHHCPVVGLCVGKNNLLSFQIMAISISLYHMYLLMSGIILLVNIGRRNGFGSKGSNWWEASVTLDITVVGFLMAIMLPAILSNMKCEQDPPRRAAVNRWAYAGNYNPRGLSGVRVHSNSQEPGDVENGNRNENGTGNNNLAHLSNY